MEEQEWNAEVERMAKMTSEEIEDEIADILAEIELD